MESFVKFKVTTTNIVKHASTINAHLDSVRICDPAIGSGAFPMGLLHEIFSVKQHLKEVAKLKELQTISNVQVKENIIQNSIYGVDIEKGAVDIARLRFWLKSIVDEAVPKATSKFGFQNRRRRQSCSEV